MHRVFSGMFALDDYGSGYSNEGSLLELAPRFIKVDISIIRGIDSDPDKQQILRNVVRYAQPRSMQIIAEGVETAAEMRTVIDLGGRPAAGLLPGAAGRCARPHCPGGSGDHPSYLGQQPPEALLNRPKEQEIPYRTGISCSFYTVRNAIWHPANLPLVFGRALRYTGVERKTAREVL